VEWAAIRWRGDQVGDPRRPALARKLEIADASAWDSKVMLTDATIEDRLTALEAAVAELRGNQFIQRPAPDWLEQVIGSFKDEPAFEEVLAYGRAIRKGEPLPLLEDDGS
jgi:hypothetical protein